MVHQKWLMMGQSFQRWEEVMFSNGKKRSSCSEKRRLGLIRGWIWPAGRAKQGWPVPVSWHGRDVGNAGVPRVQGLFCYCNGIGRLLVMEKQQGEWACFKQELPKIYLCLFPICLSTLCSLERPQLGKGGSLHNLHWLLMFSEGRAIWNDEEMASSLRAVSVHRLGAALCSIVTE